MHLPTLPPLLAKNAHVLGFIPTAKSAPMLEMPQATHMTFKVGLRATSELLADHATIHADVASL